MRVIMRMKRAACGVMVTDMMRASGRRQATRMGRVDQNRVVHRTDGDALGCIKESDTFRALVCHDREQGLALDDRLVRTFDLAGAAACALCGVYSVGHDDLPGWLRICA
jgi:hypothetical protein